MTRSALCFSVILLTLVSSAVAQIERGKLSQRFEQLEGNKDEKLTPKEFPRRLLFRRLDRNNDGVITREEAQGGAPTATTSNADMVVKRDVAYGKHEAQQLDVYAPQKTVKRAPTMVFVHSGVWKISNKSGVGQKATFFTDQGWVFVSIGYRLLPDGRHPRNVEDVTGKAMDFLKSLLGKNSTR